MAIDTTGFDYASVAVPPGVLFVAADEPLLVYPSVAAAESHLEAVDVRTGVYPTAYGPYGEVYRIDADGDHVVIEPTNFTYYEISTNATDLNRISILR